MDIQNHNRVLKFILPNKIDYSIFKYFFKIKEDSQVGDFEIIELSYEKTEFITLPGAMYLLFIVVHIIDINQKLRKVVETRISDCSETLLKTLSNFGFIHTLKIRGNLRINIHLDEYSESRILYWKNIIKSSNFSIHSLYWPISIIPIKTGYNFEPEVSGFINNFINYFNKLLNSNLVEPINDLNREDLRKDFISTVNESTKNVWDHSESWGIASIQSNRMQKSTFCLFDYGIGFIQSYVKRKGSYNRSKQEDIERIIWLFQEGNTTNSESNHGRGLQRMAKFVDRTNGFLLIKTDAYMVTYSKAKGLKVVETNYFPGTQIMINF